MIDMLRSGVPAGLEELATLARTLHRRRDDVLAYFTHRASNGPTEAINGRLEPYAATRWASATSPTTASAAYSTAATCVRASRHSELGRAPFHSCLGPALRS